jgi:hypothetical protein
MAYGQKYSSNFYNRYGKLVEIEISKQDYSGGITALRNTEVYIEVNFQDNNTPVIGTGCSIVVINQGEFISLEDLLTTQEKQFKCVIKYDSVTVFQGFSICDLNEQQFNKLARIKLQFTDYLRRLEGHFATNFFIGSNIDLLTLLQELIVKVGFGAAYQLYVNSTLFETRMNNDGLTDTFVKQTYVENNMFFSDPNTYDDVYAAVNKAFKPFTCFIYSCGDKWILERHEDITRDKNTSSWVVYNLYQTPSNTPSLKEEYNKQAGDFQYADESQVLEYASGLQKLIVNLKDKQYDTFVFNDYSTSMSTVSDQTPDPGTLQLRTWYAYQDILLLETNYDYRGIGSYVKWTYPANESNYSHMGLYYEYEVQFNLSPENPIIMDISFKVSIEDDLTIIKSVVSRYMIRVDGGTLDGLYLGYITGPDGIQQILTFVNDWTFRTEYDTSIDANKVKVWNVSNSYNFTDSQSINVVGQGSPAPGPSLWEQLGFPTSQKFMIYFLPMEINLKGVQMPAFYAKINYLGDISITLTQQKVLNKITYYINEDFVKTEEQEIEFFDLNNLNFANGLMYGLGGFGNDAIGKTVLWTSEKITTPDELMDIYAANKFRNYARTIHKLKAKILHDGYMKPFSVLTDDNIMIDSQTYNTFLLQSYTWDLFNGSYDIVAEEYTAEDIIINTLEDSGGASSGESYTGDPGVVPATPTGLDATIDIPNNQISISWDAVDGAVAYILQRKPYYDILGNWIESWQTVYEGASLSFLDQFDYNPIPSQSFYYHVLARNTELKGAYSSVILKIWA